MDDPSNTEEAGDIRVQLGPLSWTEIGFILLLVSVIILAGFFAPQAMSGINQIKRFLMGKGQSRLGRVARRFPRLFKKSRPPPASIVVERPELPSEFFIQEANNKSIKDIFDKLNFGTHDPIIIKSLSQSVSQRTLNKNEMLFSIGDDDENCYIIVSGEVEVLRTAKDQQGPPVVRLKLVKSGEAILSYLSLLQSFANPGNTYRTISAQCVMDRTRVLVLSFKSFHEAFTGDHGKRNKLIKSIMTRLQRVTFVAMTSLAKSAQIFEHPSRGSGRLTNLFGRSDLQLFIDALGLTSDQVQELTVEYLSSSISVRTYSKDEIILKEGSRNNCGLKAVITGQATLSKVSNLQEAMPGGVINVMQVLTNEPCFYTAKASQNNTKVATMSPECVARCIRCYPQVSLNLAVRVINSLSLFIRGIDFALDWEQIDSGHVLFNRGDDATHSIIVLSGRLRSVTDDDNSSTTCKFTDYGRGDMIGLEEIIVKQQRPSTVWAVRDSDVARIPSGVFDVIKAMFQEEVYDYVLKFLSEKKLLKIDDKSTKFSTAAVFPLSQLPTTQFCNEVNRALNVIDRATILNSTSVQEDLGLSPEDFHLNDYLAGKEDSNRVTIFQCDQAITDWTKLCLRHADVILLLADPNGLKEVGAMEAELQKLFPRTRKELVFLHPNGTKFPRDTALWLGDRGHVTDHFHVELPSEMSEDNDEQLPASTSRPSVHSDFSRIARHLTSTEVTLILGGGGARGCAHLGIIKALLEQGIPVDRVAGVSIGALVGALWCYNRNICVVNHILKSFAKRMMLHSPIVKSLTWPIVAYTTGYTFNESIRSYVGDHDMADTWIPLVIVTSDISDMLPRIHDIGCCWIYVRGSMTLADYLPPICDPRDGHLLMDGGYYDNVPALIMKERGSKRIISANVGAECRKNYTNFGTHLDGFWVLLSQWLPWIETIEVPGSTEQKSRLAFMNQTVGDKNNPISSFSKVFRPPVEPFETLEFDKFEEIKAVGYTYANSRIKELREEGFYNDCKPLEQYPAVQETVTVRSCTYRLVRTVES